MAPNPILVYVYCISGGLNLHMDSRMQDLSCIFRALSSDVMNMCWELL